jgi:hypothetical protein
MYHRKVAGIGGQDDSGFDKITLCFVIISSGNYFRFITFFNFSITAVSL